MAQEKTTIARPYAEAVFGRALETEELDQWSDMLGLLSAVVGSPELSGLVANPKLSRAQLQDLIIDIVGEHLNQEGQNLVKILVSNNRLPVLPQIAELFEQLKHQHKGIVKVDVRSAYDLAEAERDELAVALKQRLGQDVEITVEKDPSLLGGVSIRAGDLVIDGSVRGQLHKLANELSI
jgi:F-type H+-transporting ATPase subunit delta